MLTEIEELLYFLGFKTYSDVAYHGYVDGIYYHFLIDGKMHFYYVLDIMENNTLCKNCFTGFCEEDTLLKPKNELETYFKSYIRKKKLETLLNL